MFHQNNLDPGIQIKLRQHFRANRRHPKTKGSLCREKMVTLDTIPQSHDTTHGLLQQFFGGFVCTERRQDV